jgi:hypothetical protein
MSGSQSWRRSLFQQSLAQRMIHASILFGVPLTCWELFDLWREARHDPFFGTEAVVFGVGLAVLYGVVAAAVMAVIEHAFIRALKRGRNI